jgi:hypothetical protein
MKKIIYTLLACTIINASAQCPKASSFVAIKEQKKDGFAVSAISRSASLVSGTSYELSFVAQGGMNYRVSAETLTPNTGTVSYSIYEMVLKKNDQGVSKKVKSVLGTSADAVGGVIEIKSDKTKKLFISISLQDGNSKKAECVGVLVENKISAKEGF